MKLYRCDKCSLVYAFDDKVPGVREASDAIKCTRTYQKYSRSGIIGEYVEYCGGALVPVTLDAPPSPVEQDHGDRRTSADREGIDEEALAGWHRRHRNRRERADALSGSRVHYWQRVAIEECAREGNEAWRATVRAEKREQNEARWKAAWKLIGESCGLGAGGPDG